MLIDVTVIGKGVWGSALAQVFKASNMIAGKASAAGVSSKYCVIAVEAQRMREVISRHKIDPKTILIIATKGIEQESLKLMGQVVEETLTNKYVVLSGPNFADEISAGLPAATSIAGNDDKLVAEVIADLASPKFRLYSSNDVVAAQVGGSMKNVIAIASGICVGKKLGENARAALITRGIAEICRMTAALGGNQQTLLGLCGMGDLMLTAYNLKSRNTNLGYEIANGKNIRSLIESRSTAIEGYYTSKSVYELAKKMNIELPICNAVYEILYNNKNIDTAINELINRPQK